MNRNCSIFTRKDYGTALQKFSADTQEFYGTLSEFFLPKHQMCFLSVLQNLLFLSSRAKLAVCKLSGNALFSNWNTVILISIPLNFMWCCILPVFLISFPIPFITSLDRNSFLPLFSNIKLLFFYVPFDTGMNQCTGVLSIYSGNVLSFPYLFFLGFGFFPMCLGFFGWLVGFPLGFLFIWFWLFRQKNYLDSAADVFLSLSPKKLHCYYSSSKATR